MQIFADKLEIVYFIFMYICPIIAMFNFFNVTGMRWSICQHFSILNCSKIVSAKYLYFCKSICFLIIFSYMVWSCLHYNLMNICILKSPGAIRRQNLVCSLLSFNPCFSYVRVWLLYFIMIHSCLQICSFVWFGLNLWILIMLFPTNFWCITSEYYWVLNLCSPPIVSFNLFPSFTDDTHLCWLYIR